jgi:hypothetical protein
MAERSKAPRSGRGHENGVGSNPTLVNILFDYFFGLVPAARLILINDFGLWSLVLGTIVIAISIGQMRG